MGQVRGVGRRKVSVQYGNRWMGQATVAALGLTMGLMVVCGIFAPPLGSGRGELSQEIPIVRPINRVDFDKVDTTDTTGTSETVMWDGTQTVHLKRRDGTVEALSMHDYLWGVVAAEMPASFSLEALKAQATAARTYTEVKRSGTSADHPSADLCDDSTCCQAYVERGRAAINWGVNAALYTDKVEQAVSETDGLGIFYEGEPIEAVFFASAAGQTVDAVEVWGKDYAYLVGVDSPEGTEVPSYHSTEAYSLEEVKRRILGSYPDADLREIGKKWIVNPTYSPSGSVETLEVGGLTLTGGQVRKLFDLRSSTFTYKWKVNTLTFYVTGHGHGVGMSQYGANAMAADGADFEEIVTWYYSGTEVSGFGS